MFTVLPEMLGQACLIVLHQVSSSPGTAAPPVEPAELVDPPEVAEPPVAEDPALLADDAEDCAPVADDAEDGALLAGVLVLLLPEALLELHAVTISARAPMPAMVAIAFRADRRDTEDDLRFQTE
jgi:hypothetical protein